MLFKSKVGEGGEVVRWFRNLLRVAVGRVLFFFRVIRVFLFIVVFVIFFLSIVF